MNRFTLCVPGIFTLPDDGKGWAYRATEFIEDGGYGIADHYDYFAGAVRVWQTDRINEVEYLLAIRQSFGHYDGHDAIGHSNGTVLLLEALKRDKALHIDNLHLVASAADRDFRRNGLNDLLESGRVKHLHLYVSSGDWALVAARCTRWLFGFGDLGRRGPSNATPAALQKTTIIRKTCGHGQWLTDQFHDTLANVVRTANA